MTEELDLEKEFGVNLPPEKAAPKPRAKREPVPVPEVKTAAVGMPKDYIRIILDEHDDIPPTGLFVGVNGTGYLIRPGEEVNVPRGVIEVLDNAVAAQPVTDPQTRRVIGYRDRRRFSYRRVAA